MKIKTEAPLDLLSQLGINVKIKTGMTFKSTANGKKGRIGDLFEPRERWDDSRDPEWYVHFEGYDLKILPESVIKTTLAFDTV